MAKVKEIARSYSQKVNTGNYETKDFFCSATVEVGENESAEEVAEETFQFCKRMVERSIEAVLPKAEAPQEQVEQTLYAMDRLWCKRCKSNVGICRRTTCDNCDFCGTSVSEPKYSEEP